MLKISPLFKNLQTSRADNSRILWVKKYEIFKVLFLYEHKYIGRFSNLHQCTFNPSRPDPERLEKINKNVYFHSSLWYLKRFYKGLKGLPKAF